MNKVVLIGRLTKDPELKRTPSDIPYVQFTLAVNRNFQNVNGERQADFISCVAWRNQAENLARYIKKGGLIAVDGSIQTSSYDDPSGVKKFTTTVACNQISFLEAKKDDTNKSGYNDFNQVPQQPYNNYNNNNNYNNGYNNSYNNGYNNNNYQNHAANNGYNQNNGYSQQPKNEPKSPFQEIDNSFDISDDDLPF